MFDYPVTLTPDDGTVLVTFPDVPEAITFGHNEAEAKQQAVDALETALSLYINDHLPLPVPSVIDGAITVFLQSVRNSWIALCQVTLLLSLKMGCHHRKARH